MRFRRSGVKDSRLPKHHSLRRRRSPTGSCSRINSRIRQFEYQWLRALSNHYADFWHATEDALVFSTKSLKLELTPGKRDELMGMYLELPTWPDVPQA